MFIASDDGIRIHYEVIGAGPVVLLLHGFGDDLSIWAQSGWIEKLANEYTVAAMDLRGCGGSDKPGDPANYSIEAHCSDIYRVLDTLEDRNPIIWGWSLGATIAMHYTARKKIKATIACGSYFGLVFSDEFVEKCLRDLKDETNAVRMKAFNKWPIVLPGQMKNPFLMYSGTNDGNVVVQLRDQKNEIEAAGGKLVIFDDVDHVGLIRDTNTIAKTVLEFIRSGDEVSRRP